MGAVIRTINKGLAENPFLSDYPDLVERLIEAGFERIELGEGWTLQEYYQNPESVCLIQEGYMCKERIKTVEGTSKELRIVSIKGPNYLINLHSSLGFDSEAQWEALTPAVVYSLDGKIMRNFLKESADFCLEVMDMYKKDLNEQDDFLLSSVWGNIPGRVAYTLEYLARNFGKQTEKGVQIVIPLTQERIGYLAGTNRETVNKTIKMFKKEGIVATPEKGKLRIVTLLYGFANSRHRKEIMELFPDYLDDCFGYLRKDSETIGFKEER